MVYDALVIGGGPAGSTAAILLAMAGWSVVVVERSQFPRRKVCGEYLSATNLPLLDYLDVGADFRAQAGPPIRKVAVFAGEFSVEADLPVPREHEWGRALSRERFDTLLLERARHTGADVRQPWKVLSIAQDGGDFRCVAKSLADGSLRELRARVVIAAHGSWGPDPLGNERQECLPHQLMGFKAHFEKTALDPALMPLLAFPGGYGGMVHCEDGRVSLSCCIRRDRLARLRRAGSGEAGEAVLSHIEEHCRGVRNALANALRVGAWLAAGPLRPGLRWPQRDGVLLAGNAAGEAHPVIAEGISMAMQSAWLLCRRLVPWKERDGSAAGLEASARSYSAAWRRHFARRLQLSRLVAQWAMRPALVRCTLPLLRFHPAALTWFAQLSGKAHGILSPKRSRGSSSLALRAQINGA